MKKLAVFIIISIIIMLFVSSNNKQELSVNLNPFVNTAEETSKVSAKPASNTIDNRINTTTPYIERGSMSIESIPVILQNDTSGGQRAMPSGCEATAAAMILNYYGYDINKNQIADMIPCRVPDNYGYHPNEYFIGSPYSSSYGVFADPVAKVMEQTVSQFNGDHIINNLTGCAESEIYRYLDMKIPVIVWVTNKLKPLLKGDSWLLSDGAEFIWPKREHCMVITGYDKKYFYVNDPLEGDVRYDRNLFIERWTDMGNQTIVMY